MCEFGEFFEFGGEGGGDFGLDQFGDAVGDFGKVGDSQGAAHAGAAAKGVDQQGQIGATDVFEEQGFAAIGGFHDAVGDFSDFEVRIDRGGDAEEVVGLFEFGDEFV